MQTIIIRPSFGNHVDIENSKQDRYGHTLGKVLVNGIDVNLEQVKIGFAWFYRKYKKGMIFGDRLYYLHAEEAAHTAKIGLWADQEP